MCDINTYFGNDDCQLRANLARSYNHHHAFRNFVPSWHEVLSFSPATYLQSCNEVLYHICGSGNVSQFETHFTSITNWAP